MAASNPSSSMMGPPSVKAGNATATACPASAQTQGQGVKRSAKLAFEGELFTCVDLFLCLAGGCALELVVRSFFYRGYAFALPECLAEFQTHLYMPCHSSTIIYHPCTFHLGSFVLQHVTWQHS
jgi:hypothetical protein